MYAPDGGAQLVFDGFLSVQFCRIIGRAEASLIGSFDL
jgi:hypothetical protein